MATKRNKYDVQHDRLLRGYLNEIEDIYQSACLEAAKIGVSVGKLSADTVFSFKDYPTTHKRIKRLMSQMAEQIQLCIVNGVQSEWTLANNKNNELCRQVFGDNIGKLTKTQYNRYFNNHDEAREAFLKRKDNGLNLSDNVWRYTNQFKMEIELGLDVGLRSGRSADELSRDLRGYLKYPDQLFRRVRDADGNLQLSRAARAFHPGRGVYRSSYKNARRLTATETNIAYRTADYLRYQDLDFVVGIRIVQSNNHTLLGSDGAPHAFTDICDELSAPMGSKATKGRGCYPKDFKFTGWHPHCRCHVETILKSDEEIGRDTERLLQGEEPLADSVNTVSELPEEMQTWLSMNQKRIEGAKTLPYWIQDNRKIVEKAMSDADKEKQLDAAIKETSQKAHAVGEEVQSLAESIASKYEAACTPINYKSETSIKRKVLAERAEDGPNFSPDMLKDAVRTTIIAPKDKIADVIDTLSQEPQVKAIGDKAIKKQLPKDCLGYSGNIVNLKTSNGLTAEIQVNTAKMIYAKELPENAKKILGEKVWNDIRKEVGVEGGLGHKYYEEWRVMSKEEQLSSLGQTLKKRSEEYYTNFTK